MYTHGIMTVSTNMTRLYYYLMGHRSYNRCVFTTTFLLVREEKPNRWHTNCKVKKSNKNTLLWIACTAGAAYSCTVTSTHCAMRTETATLNNSVFENKNSRSESFNPLAADGHVVDSSLRKFYPLLPCFILEFGGVGKEHSINRAKGLGYNGCNGDDAVSLWSTEHSLARNSLNQSCTPWSFPMKYDCCYC